MSTAGPTTPTERLFTPEFLTDPAATYAELREDGPAYFSPTRLRWFLLDHADVKAVLRDPRWSSQRMTTTIGARSEAMQAELGSFAAVASRLLIFTDPPDHTRLRGLVSAAFTPRMVERMRGRITSLVTELLDQVAPDGGMDLIADLAYSLPTAVILDILGMPVADRDRFKAWTTDIAGLLGNATLDEEADRRGQAATLEAVDWFDTMRQNLCRCPRDDLLSALVLAETEGDRLSAEDLVGIALSLLIAGHETTTNLIGNGTLALLRNPDQADRLRADPDLVDTAVEEFLRYDPPITYIGRVATEEMAVAGRVFAPGEPVSLLLGAANRDPAVYTAPDRLDIARVSNPHLSLGRGPHFCLGAVLGRLEAKIVFTVLLDRFPRLRLAADAVEWQPNFVFHGLATLPVTW